MDKKIYTLLTIYIVFLAVCLAMVLSVGAQKVLTAIIFGGAGTVIFLIMFLLWMLNRKHEG